MHSWDMLVETPVCEAELEDRTRHPDHDNENQCSDCGVGEGRRWFPTDQIMVVRHWTTNSQDIPGGGHWTWYCPEHFERRNGNWWKTSHLAPARLLPEITHRCARKAELGMLCGDTAVEPFDGVWVCERHAARERLERRLREIMSSDAVTRQ